MSRCHLVTIRVDDLRTFDNRYTTRETIRGDTREGTQVWRMTAKVSPIMVRLHGVSFVPNAITGLIYYLAQVINGAAILFGSWTSGSWIPGLARRLGRLVGHIGQTVHVYSLEIICSKWTKKQVFT